MEENNLSSKIIVVNPDLFTATKKTRKQRQNIKRPSPSITPSKLYRKLYSRATSLNNSNTTHEQPILNTSNTPNTQKNHEVSESIAFMNQLKAKRPSSHIRTLKSHNSEQSHHHTPDIFVNTTMPPELNDIPNQQLSATHPVIHINQPPPPYGCLKGGTKPLYREWKQMQTCRNKDIYSHYCWSLQ